MKKGRASALLFCSLKKYGEKAHGFNREMNRLKKHRTNACIFVYNVLLYTHEDSI